MTLQGVTWTQAQVLADLNTAMDDSGNTRWTSDQKKHCINMAIRRARGRWWETRIDDSNTYSESTFRYALPPACEHVEEIFWEPDSTDLPRPLVSPKVWRVENDYIVFSKAMTAYDGQTMYIRYLVYPHSINSLTASDGVITGTGTDASFSSSTGGFTTAATLVQEGDEVVISGDGTYYVDSVTSNIALELHKPATVDTSLTFYINYYTDTPITYLLYASMAEMYELASRNKPGEDIDDNIRWATYYRQLADNELRLKQRHLTGARRF